jgi:hypothetical protein
MLKTRICKLKDYIKERRKKNGGIAPELLGPNGFKTSLTVKNYRAARDNILNMIKEEKKRSKTS